MLAEIYIREKFLKDAKRLMMHGCTRKTLFGKQKIRGDDRLVNEQDENIKKICTEGAMLRQIFLNLMKKLMMNKR